MFWGNFQKYNEFLLRYKLFEMGVTILHESPFIAWGVIIMKDDKSESSD